MNISDLITQAILETIEEAGGSAQIQRNEFANRIGCVPSQINYVITSRFTPEQGYIVESKRGGGGYIRIVKVKPDPHHMMMHLINSLGHRLDENSARIILQNLCSDGLLTAKEGKMILSAVSNHVLKQIPLELRDIVRATIFKSLLMNSIDY